MALTNENHLFGVRSVAVLLKTDSTQLQKLLQDFQKHYHSSAVVIKGKKRDITVPSKELKSFQRKINKFILKRFKFPESMHGYNKGHSVNTNASVHVGKKFVAKYDIRSFFPSIHHTRVNKIYKSLELNEQQAQILTTLSTADYCVPHGFPTSSTLAVLSLVNLDRRFKKAFRGYDFDYTFYSDDITISANREIVGFEALIYKMIKQEGFKVKKDKKKYLGNYKRQKVTGNVVNERVSLPIERRELIKSIVNNCVVQGPGTQINKYWGVFGEAKSREKSKAMFKERLSGMIKNVSILHKSYGQKLKRRFNQIDWKL
ncbi:MAG: reverse transcriptase family protein [Candidatus Omnitrophota bacterium]|nr:reverse transcriptase family protein [Candidatus Omnitrophota bacterium]